MVIVDPVVGDAVDRSKPVPAQDPAVDPAKGAFGLCDENGTRTECVPGISNATPIRIVKPADIVMIGVTFNYIQLIQGIV